jgi:hypothetical protein
MKKLLVAGVAGLMLLAGAGSQMATAAAWRAPERMHYADRGHFVDRGHYVDRGHFVDHGRYVERDRFVARPAYRSVYAEPRYCATPVVRNYCW